MPLLLRKIRKSKWYNDGRLSWLPKGSLEADALADLKTTGNILSLWQIEDDRSNLNQVVAAIAANSGDVSNVDCAIFDEKLMSEISIKVEQTRGESCYEEAVHWHRDLIELSAENVMDLAKTILERAEIKRFSEKYVLGLISEAVATGNINPQKLQLKVQERLNKMSP